MATDLEFDTCPSVPALSEAGYIFADLDVRVSQITIVTSDSVLTYERSASTDVWVLIGTAEP